MPINGLPASALAAQNRSFMPGGFRGPNSGLMPDFGGANAALELRLMETVRFLHNAVPRANGLNAAVSNLSSAFAPRNVVSGNTDILRINSFTGQSLAPTYVTVNQLATTQRNEGVGLVRTAPFVLPQPDVNDGTGAYEDYDEAYDTKAYDTETNGSETSKVAETTGAKFKFEVSIGDETHEISFLIEEDEEITNQQFQQRMAAAINNADIGINATVTSSGNHSVLNLETKTTGAGEDDQPRFTLNDISGNAVAHTGVNNIVQEGQNAEFTVSPTRNGAGESRISASNSVTIVSGLSVTLVKASKEPVPITLGQDSASMRNGVRNLVNQFNAMIETASGNAADRTTRLLISNLGSAARSSRRALGEVGITIRSDGTLSINEAQLTAAAENGALERFFNGQQSGRGPNAFVSRVSRIADNVANNPMRHVSPHASRMPGFNSAMNALRASQNSSGSGSSGSGSSGSGSSGSGANASPFEDAYFPDHWMNLLLDALR